MVFLDNDEYDKDSINPDKIIDKLTFALGKIIPDLGENYSIELDLALNKQRRSVQLTLTRDSEEF